MSATTVSPNELPLRMPVAISVILHLLAAGALVMSRPSAPVPSAPMYKVSLVAAPPGPRQVGVVSETPPAAAPVTPPAPAPRARTMPEPARMKSPVAAPAARAPRVATPNATVAPAKASEAPRAGGGETGGRGADVANVTTNGIDFPYPGYLQNVVRQIALRFKPSRGGALKADVAFLIRRDGSVTGLRLQARSGVYSFDTDALGAVDAAAQARAFGPLPQGFSDDVLPVIFSFDPRLIR